jgi:signal transduction histidine kinase
LKHPKLGIRWKIYLYLTGFVAIIIVLLWLFQIVFLDDFYKAIKISEVKQASQSIENNIDNDDLSALVIRIAQDSQLCISIIDSDGSAYINVDALQDCILSSLSQADLLYFYEQAQQNDDEYLELFLRDSYTNIRYDAGKYVGIVPDRDAAAYESILYAKIITLESGQSVCLIVNAEVSPVTATVRTLRVQLLYITFILLGLALVLAFFISRHISKPIADINRSAKILAEGNYDVKFDGSGYREIGELSDTLNYASEELSKVERLRRELIANISHDLRTPLTMITGYSEIMRDIPGENTPENVQIIIDEANRLTSLVNDLLDVSKLQSGTQTLHCAELNLTRLIQNTLTRYQKLLQNNPFDLRFNWEQEIVVSADPLQISQVIYNLINNAIHYTGEDRRVNIRQIIENGKVRIEIEDTGEGIEKEQLPYIWERYYKADKTHRRPIIGTGLGLSIVITVLELHHAEYCVISEKEHGSIFWFELPIISIVTNDNDIAEWNE